MQRSQAKGVTALRDAEVGANDAKIQGNVVRKILKMMLHKHRDHKSSSYVIEVIEVFTKVLYLELSPPVNHVEKVQF